MKRVRKTIICSIIIAIGATVGCLVAWLAQSALSNGTLALWQPLPALPETASGIFAVPAHQGHPKTIPVYIQTVSDKVLVCCTATEPTWVVVSEPPFEYPPEPCEGAYDTASRFRLTNLPSAITTCARAPQNWEWVLSDAYFVILADNSVWRWHRYVGIDRVLVFACSGSSLGILVTIGLLLISRRQRSSAAIGAHPSR